MKNAHVGKKSNQLTIKTEALPQEGAKRTFVLSLDDFRAHLSSLARDCGGNAELARRLGITGQFVDYLISGKRKPGRKALAALGARRRVMIEIDVEVSNGG